MEVPPMGEGFKVKIMRKLFKTQRRNLKKEKGDRLLFSFLSKALLLVKFCLIFKFRLLEWGMTWIEHG